METKIAQNDTDSDFTQDRIGKYILYCKLRSENRTHRYKQNHHITNDAEFFHQEYSRCMEKYYTICLKDVYVHNMREPYHRRNINICEKIIDAYLMSAPSPSSPPSST